MKIHPVGAELFHGDRQKGKRTDMMKLTVKVCSFANMPKNSPKSLSGCTELPSAVPLSVQSGESPANLSRDSSLTHGGTCTRAFITNDNPYMERFVFLCRYVSYGFPMQCFPLVSHRFLSTHTVTPNPKSSSESNYTYI